ncbi:hypothetical protein CLV58_109246 [Spirosoma oryzae]|uniref:Uncharacterized protein n=1 Tax=Spirosoma oryzae TaxID=1469603 RepID=A0A2T0SYQ1_9BACT|nr:hypothetical protein CLV58_109246 [Spirosoma oryzae]
MDNPPYYLYHLSHSYNEFCEIWVVKNAPKSGLKNFNPNHYIGSATQEQLRGFKRGLRKQYGSHVSDRQTLQFLFKVYSAKLKLDGNQSTHGGN